MSEEILINFTPMETRVALVINGSSQDIHIERSVNRGIVGNLYAGKVVRVLPGMQAAFVDIGLKRTGFIHVADIVVVDSRECFVTLQQFCGEYMPEMAGLLEHFSGARPLLDLCGVEDEIQRRLFATRFFGTSCAAPGLMKRIL